MKSVTASRMGWGGAGGAGYTEKEGQERRFGTVLTNWGTQSHSHKMGLGETVPFYCC